MSPVIDVITTWLRGLPAHQPGQVITAQTELIEYGLLDSIAILELVGFLEGQFNVALPIDDFVPENFQTPQAIAAMVARLVPDATAGDKSYAAVR